MTGSESGLNRARKSPMQELTHNLRDLRIALEQGERRRQPLRGTTQEASGRGAGSSESERSERQLRHDYTAALEKCRNGEGTEDDMYKALSNYLTTKFPGASPEFIEQHAKSRGRRAWSFTKTSILNTAGATFTATATALAPKLATLAGINWSTGVALTTLGGISSAFVPVLLTALPFALSYGAMRGVRYMSRDERMGRKAGNILRRALDKSGPQYQRLRTAMTGDNLFKEFDTMIQKKGIRGWLEKHSETLWGAGMLGTGGFVGTLGAGSIAILGKMLSGETITGYVGSDGFQTSNFLGDFWDRLWGVYGEGVTGPSAAGAGIQEMEKLGGYFLENAAATVGVGDAREIALRYATR